MADGFERLRGRGGRTGRRPRDRHRAHCHRTVPRLAYNDISELDAEATYPQLARALAPFGLAHPHGIEDNRDLTAVIRKLFSGPLLFNVKTEGHTTPARLKARASLTLPGQLRKLVLLDC